jgi:protein-disulfide isomerase
LEEAQRLLPRADLSGLTGAQRAELLEVAGDTFDYAGCNSTLAACLRADVKDPHAPRMARLASLLIRDGLPTSQIIFYLERYYAGFDKAKRKKLAADDCPVLGDPRAKVTLVEFSDYQCPHCAAALKPLHELVTAPDNKVKLCSKYFPLPGHPRARLAAACAEYARKRGKFWEMNRLLFDHQEELDDANLRSFAQQLKLDGNDMLKEAYAGKFEAIIERHLKEGAAAEVQATPSLFLNGRLHTLPVKLEYLRHSVEDELEWQRNGGAWDKV